MSRCPAPSTNASSYHTCTSCRVCGSTDLIHVFSLGEQYVSDFVNVKDFRPHLLSAKCPITLELCRHCSLLQAKHSPHKELLYRRHYWYRSGTTATMRAALKDVALAAERVAKLKPGDVVLDIGSNDGTLLRSYSVDGLYRIGVEPASNLVEDGCRGIDLLINNFWSASLLKELRPRVITACGMLYDLENPNQFIKDVVIALAPNGVFIAQLMCLRNMLNVGDIGNLAHEHLEFYSLASLNYMLHQTDRR